ncbi:cob(I)yrinic acid a,c-diamide adenosyltransferase [Ectothiorhodospiraceae bacterium 2226]|nr:cob(I)yrinic acid a,c-diamide adenosyltransferase [Ectothiorhodospiraceae bacterium 2226]
MGNRLTKIYTKTGDNGTTGLGDGTRVDKDDARVEAFGCVDELNSALGVVLAHELPETVHEALTTVQHELFDLGGELCIPGRVDLQEAQVGRLERVLDTLNGPLPPLKEFILPGGTPAASACHVARALCRRAERRLVTLAKATTINPASLRYLNRLSDLLFVVARHLNRTAGAPDVLWQPGRQRA